MLPAHQLAMLSRSARIFLRMHMTPLGVYETQLAFKQQTLHEEAGFRGCIL